MLYRLSKLFPVRMRSTYRASATERCQCCGNAVGMLPVDATDPGFVPMRSAWWQFRGRIFRHVQRVV